MVVSWTDQISAARMETIWSMYPEADSFDFDKDYTGEVIGTTKGFWGTTYLVVACTDGKVREVEADKVKIHSN